MALPLCGKLLQNKTCIIRTIVAIAVIFSSLGYRKGRKLIEIIEK